MRLARFPKVFLEFFLLLITFFIGCSQKGMVSSPKKTLSSDASSRRLKTPLLPSGHWVPLKRRNFSQYYTTLGSLYPEREVQLGSAVSGIVKKIYFLEGDYVPRGEPLLRLDSTYLNLAAQKANAQVQVLQRKIDLARSHLQQAKVARKMAAVSLEEAKAHFQRIQALWKGKSPRESAVTKEVYERAYYNYERQKIFLEKAQIAVEVAKKNLRELESLLNQARISLALAHQRLRDTKILAPFSGVIEKWMVEVGSKVTAAPATRLLLFAKINPLKLRFPLPQKYYSLVHLQGEIRFRVLGQKQWKKSTIQKILPQVDPKSRNLLLESYISNPGPPFRYLPGMLAEVQVKLREIPQVFVVPKEALLPSEKGWALWVRRGKTIKRVYPVFLAEGENEVALQGEFQEGDLALVVKKGGGTP